MNTRIDRPILPAERWVKPSRCVPCKNCIELNSGMAGVVGVRDSKGDPAEFLTFGSGPWSTFLASR